MKTLKIEHLACYLPYGLKGYSNKAIKLKTGGFIPKEHTLSITNVGDLYAENKLHLIKPILRPLSDYNDINSKAMMELNCDLTDQMNICELAQKTMSLHKIPYSTICVMNENHIDYHNLIEDGLAVDINTLK
ncbi:MAG: hypothetical protein OEY89_01370 [Gammaproteobacteria bacterium]|nr:hypothetical protein [Gammaproteobacteria bacterium]